MCRWPDPSLPEILLRHGQDCPYRLRNRSADRRESRRKLCCRHWIWIYRIWKRRCRQRSISVPQTVQGRCLCRCRQEFPLGHRRTPVPMRRGCLSGQRDFPAGRHREGFGRNRRYLISYGSEFLPLCSGGLRCRLMRRHWYLQKRPSRKICRDCPRYRK